MEDFKKCGNEKYINEEYQSGIDFYNKGIETNDYIKSWDMSYAQGNVVKYVTRYNLKHKDKNLQRQDLEKAEWYLKDLIQELKN